MYVHVQPQYQNQELIRKAFTSTPEARIRSSSGPALFFDLLLNPKPATKSSHSMDNYTNLFRQYSSRIHNMLAEAFVPPLTPPSFSDLLAANIIAAISITTLLFLILHQTLSLFINTWLLIPGEPDLERGIIYGSPNIMQRLGIIKRFIPEEGRGPMLRALNKLPPLVNYGSHKTIKSSSRRSGTECAICLEDFSEGQSCQVFALCNHMFHANCIDNWLMNRPTCPICRNCIMDE